MQRIRIMRIARAFTLIELLVVITIIVVLLSLLAPALDKAVYQAELAVCGSHLKTVATGVTVYASGSKRAYPYRPTIELGGWKRPDNIVYTAAYDDRDYLMPLMGMDALLDPLSGGIKLDPGSTTTSASVWSNYALWFGMIYTRDGKGGPGMKRIGDRWTWDGMGFDLIATDYDAILFSASDAVASHQDRDGTMEHYAMQNRAAQDYGTTKIDDIDGRMTISRWVGMNTWRRGLQDMNFAHTDGSVVRLVDLKPNGDPNDKATLDERMAMVAMGNGPDPVVETWHMNVPKP
jgi:prepilin-type N-terminal cleavage/methylation domain-containing protein